MLIRSNWVAVAFLCGVVSGSAVAQEKELTAEQFHAQLQYRTGKVDLGTLATLTLSNEFRFLDAQQATRVLVEAWGNPPKVALGIHGMILPSKIEPLDKNSWGVVISYESEGHVEDGDAESIDYTSLLKEMQDEVKERNREFVKQGYESMEIVGWAEPPSYDKESHKLYWAKELRVGSHHETTLNYDIRVLGRDGVLVLNAVGTMDQLQAIKKGMSKILTMVDFKPGRQYSDFDPSKDKVAEYGIAALVAGGAVVAAKAGLFKWLIAVILAGKKFIVIGVLALLAGFRALFGLKKKTKATPQRQFPMPR